MKRIIVIGGTSGYGAGIAKQLKDEGNDVFVFGSSSKPRLDVTNEKDIIDRLNEIGNFDVLIYSAGLAIGKDYVSNKNNEDFKKVFAVNTLGLLSTLKHSYEYLKKSEGHFEPGKICTGAVLQFGKSNTADGERLCIDRHEGMFEIGERKNCHRV